REPRTELGVLVSVTDGFPIPEVTTNQVVENGSHGIKIAKTGDFWRFSAAFADPECRAGALNHGYRAEWN
ncbi:MAG: hypothetical protein ACJ8AW_19105, partial [Rhodopila sp.]